LTEKEQQALKTIKKHMWGAMGAGLIPFLAVDLLAVSAVQLKMVAAISKIYGVPFVANCGKAVIGSLFGSLAPNAGGGFAASAIFKTIPLINLFGGAVMALISGAPLDGPANPATLTYVPTPEWFYLPLDQLLVFFPTELVGFGVFVVVGIGATLMLALPFIDRNPDRHPVHRPDVLIPAFFLIFTVIYLAMLGVNRLYNL